MYCFINYYYYYC